MATRRKRAGTAIEFTCRGPDKHQVYLAGTFNDWGTTATRLKKSRDGVWKVRLPLQPGRYEYKLLVDGQWCCEPGCGDGLTFKCGECGKCIQNAFGTMNRVIEVN